jgi:prepilin-type N-terminal cleavage/methylation domain-containing protein
LHAKRSEFGNQRGFTLIELMIVVPIVVRRHRDSSLPRSDPSPHREGPGRCGRWLRRQHLRGPHGARSPPSG